MQTLKAYIEKSQDNWSELLPGVMMAFQLTPAKGSQFSPHKLLFGRYMNLPFDTSVLPVKNMGKDPEKYFQSVVDQLKLVEEMASRNIERSKEQYKQQYDKHSKSPKFSPGDLVLLENKKSTKRFVT